MLSTVKPDSSTDCESTVGRQAPSTKTRLSAGSFTVRRMPLAVTKSSAASIGDGKDGQDVEGRRPISLTDRNNHGSFGGLKTLLSFGSMP